MQDSDDSHQGLGVGTDLGGQWQPYTDPVTFERWWGQKPGPAVDGDYGRTVWPPLIGPAAWRLWATIATRTQATGCWVSSLEQLAVEHDLAAVDVPLELLELARHGLATTTRPDHWYVRAVCPPPRDRHVFRTHYRRHYDLADPAPGDTGISGSFFVDQAGALIGAPLGGLDRG